MQQQQTQVAHSMRQRQREAGMVQTTLTPPLHSAQRELGWTKPERNHTLLGGGKSTSPPQARSPDELRIQRMLASTGGARHKAFYASETSKFNSAQPQARRGQESSIAIGVPSPEEQAAYDEYLASQ